MVDGYLNTGFRLGPNILFFFTHLHNESFRVGLDLLLCTCMSRHQTCPSLNVYPVSIGRLLREGSMSSLREILLLQRISCIDKKQLLLKRISKCLNEGWCGRYKKRIPKFYQQTGMARTIREI